MGRALGSDAYLSRMVRDPGGSGRMHHEVGIRCRKCAAEEWATAPTPGWGRRIFKQKGWDCGNGITRHTCPGCASGGKSKPRPPQAQAAPAPTAFAPAAEVHQLPEPERPIIHVHQPEEPPMAPTALAEALAPVQAEMKKHETVKGSRGKPTGYANKNSAQASAHNFCRRRLGIEAPRTDKHFRIYQDPDGTWAWTLLGTLSAKTPGPDSKVRILRTREGHPVTHKSSAVSQAKLACERAGVATPIEGIHFEISGGPGQGWKYRLLDATKAQPAAAPPPLGRSGFLSRFDAKKAALNTLAPLRKSGGAPQEDVDFWLTQDGFNMWGWTTTNPNPPNQTEVPPQPEEKVVGDVVAIADQPRVPSRADNRKIMDALEEHYDAAAGRYRASFSDASLAQKLDVPRAWVTKVREEFFGPEGNEADAEAQRQRMAKLDRAVDLAERVTKESLPLLEKVAEIESILAELRKLREEAAR